MPLTSRISVEVLIRLFFLQESWVCQPCMICSPNISQLLHYHIDTPVIGSKTCVFFLKYHLQYSTKEDKKKDRWNWNFHRIHLSATPDPLIDPSRMGFHGSMAWEWVGFPSPEIELRIWNEEHDIYLWKSKGLCRRRKVIGAILVSESVTQTKHIHNKSSFVVVQIIWSMVVWWFLDRFSSHLHSTFKPHQQ